MPDGLVRVALAHPRAIIATWLMVVIASIVVLVAGSGDIAETGYTVPGSESARVDQLIRGHIPGARGTTIVAVLEASRPNLTAPSSTVKSYFARPIRLLRRLPHVEYAEQVAAGFEGIARPPDPLLAIVPITLDLSFAATEKRVPEIERVLRNASGRGESFGLVGSVMVARRYASIARQDLVHAETLALPISLATLCVAFLSLVAAALPVVLAAFTLAATLAALNLISLQVGLSVFVINTASAVALGLSIDYALIVVSRFREERRLGAELDQAIARAMQTAGRSVIVSGLAVAASASALAAIGVSLFSSIAIGGILASLIAALAATTLLPAVLCVIGTRLDILTLRRAAAAERRGGLWRGLAKLVTTHPAAAGLTSLALLVALALPALSLRLDVSSVSELPSHDPVTVVLRRVSAVFGQGAVGLVEIVTKRPGTVAGVVRGDPAVLGDAVTLKGTGGWYLDEVDLRSPPDSDAAHRAVASLRRQLHSHGGRSLVGGVTASEMDLIGRVSSRIPVVIAVAVLVGFLALAVGLRSIIVPLKAVLSSVLSVAATLGILLRCFPSAGSHGLAFFVPIVVFAVVFGLSIDYEVFLVSRIQEAAALGHSTKTSVGIGLMRSGRPITLAALTVATVFVVFWLSALEGIRELGLGVGVAILLDVTIVRCIFVPASIILLGRWNWWFPVSRRIEQAPVGDGRLDSA